MATRHKQQLAGYLAHHKHITNTSSTNRSAIKGTPASASQASTKHAVGVKQNSTNQKPHPAKPSSQIPKPARSTLHRPAAPTQLTGKTANLDGHLPDEILLTIFTYLDVVSLLQASQVNRRWCTLARDDCLWKAIAERYARVDKTVRETAERSGNTESFKTQWRNVCIARCAKWRNQRALKLVKTTRLNPFTGLPRDTEKALRESGLTYQLSLVDSYGKESCVDSSKVTLHKSSAGVTWHSLHFLPLQQVRRLRILAVCPLFYNDGGQVVRGSPYQRSLLWESDVRLSDWTTEKHVLASDDQITMYKIPGDLLLATWKADGEIAFFVAGLHYHHLVQRCLLGRPTECYVPQPHKVIPDDIDSAYGLHDYKATVELRTFGQTLWSQQFSGLHCRRHDLALGTARFTLIDHDNTVDHTPLERNVGVPWRTELFKGCVQGVAWLDVTMLDERGEVFFAASSPLKGERPRVKGSDLEYEEDQHLLMKYEGDRASVHLQIGKLDYGKAFVRHLELLVKAATINEWFGTSYLTP